MVGITGGVGVVVVDGEDVIVLVIYRSLGRFLPDCVVVMMMVGDGEYMCGRSAVGKFDSEQPVALLYCSCCVLDLALAI